MKPRLKTPRPSRRGLTLIELLVGTFIALTLTAAAVAFAVHETRLMGASQDRLVIAQTTHAALDLMADDIAQAGTGIGYDGAGNFDGLMFGNFNVGGCAYGPNNIALTQVGVLNSAGPVYNVPTTDFGVRYANGHYAGIADYNETSGTGQHCQDIDFNDISFVPNELVVLRSDSGLAAQTFTITSAALLGGTTFAGCTYTECNNTPGRCVNFSFAVDPTWQTDPQAANFNYARGEIAGGYREVVWYVEQSSDPALNHQFGSLRRAEFTTGRLPGTCVNRAGSGSEITDYVETLLVQPYTLVGGVWTRWVGPAPITTADPIRVDVELVIRSQSAATAVQADPVLRLANPIICIPNAACGANTDRGRRYVYRTSVEIKNSARVRM